MRSLNLPRLFISCVALLAFALSVSGKDYQWFPQGDAVSYADPGNWYDLDPAADPHNPSGPPIAGDTADLISGANVNVTTGAAQRLTGAGTAQFNVNSNFTVQELNTRLTLGGSGVLAATNVMSAPVVVGGHLTAQTFSDSAISIRSGGSMEIESDVRGQAGNTVNLFVDGGGMLTVNGEAVDVSGAVLGGGHVTLHSFSNVNTTVPTLSVAGPGTQFNVTTTCLIHDGSLDASNGANVLLGGSSIFEGSPTSSQSQSHWHGDGTMVTGFNFVSIGGSVGSYLVRIDDQAHVEMLTGASVAPGQGGGAVTVLDTGSTWSVMDQLVVGQQGVGLVTVGDHGLVRVIGPQSTLTIGSGGGSAGTVAMDSGSILLADGEVSIGDQPGSQGTVSLTGLSTFGLLGFGLDALTIGSAGTGHFTLGNASSLQLSGETPGVVLGREATGNGELMIGSGGNVATAQIGIPTVGRFGTGLISVSNGAANSHSVLISEKPGSHGTVNVSAAGTWVGDGTTFVGGSSLAAGGTAELMVHNGGVYRTDDLFVSGTGTVSVQPNGQIAAGTGDLGPAGSVRVSQGGILYGSGTIHGNVIVGSGGTVSPGSSPGILTIDGNYQQDFNGTWLVEIGGTDPGTGFDKITATQASLGGILNIRLVNGFIPSVGQTFRILTADSVGNGFEVVIPPSGVGMSAMIDSTGVTLEVTSVPQSLPVINSPTTATGGPGLAFSYQIGATNRSGDGNRMLGVNGAAGFGATNLPAGLKIDTNTGLISGAPAAVGTFVVPITFNNSSGAGEANLTMVIDPIFGGSLPLPSKMLNISTRMKVDSGNNVLIGGFIVSGSAPKTVAVRGIGPWLADFGIPGTLADPTLELHGSDGGLIAQNDDWQDDSVSAGQLTALGLALQDPKESGIVSTLQPSSYTAVLAGKNQTTGVGVVEIYDVNSAAESKLGNISTRGLVLTGSDIMIGGSILGGNNGNTHIVVRGIGPSLADFGLSPVLADPTLELHDANGAIVVANDDWQSDPALASQISYLELAPTNPKESGIYVSLPPGAFTVWLAGKDGGTGIGLVEIYNVQ